MLRTGLFNFSKGEIAEELIARVDVPHYAASAKRARNVVILKYGGLTKRPGMRLVGEVYNATQPTQLISFQFSLTQAYALEFGQGYMRPAAQGGFVLEAKSTITAITSAANAQITSALHGYAVGDQVYFSGVTGMTEINGRNGFVLSVIDANNFTVGIDTTGFSAFTGDSGGVVNVAPPPPPPVVPPPPPVIIPAPAPVLGGSGGYSDGDVRGGDYSAGRQLN